VPIRRIVNAGLVWALLVGAPHVCLAQFSSEPFVPVVPLLGQQDPAQASRTDPPGPPPATGQDNAQAGIAPPGQTTQFPPPPPTLQVGSRPADRTDWSGVLADSLVLLAMQHTYRIGWEARTREALKGPFWEDYWEAVTTWRGWSDGDLFRNNWIGHPAMGSASAFIYANNDPRTQRAEFWSREYASAKWRQFLFANLYSLQFELFLLSEAAIGNVDQAVEDHVITPTLGVAWSVVEDWMYVKWLSGLKQRKPALGNFLITFLNPTRSVANISALRYPWASTSVPAH